MILGAGWTIQLFKVPSRHKNLVSRKNIHKMPMMLAAAADVKRQNEKRTTDCRTNNLTDAKLYDAPFAAHNTWI